MIENSSMIEIFKKLLLSVVFLLGIYPIFASDAAGGNISYICTGAPNTYLVTLTIYRDCGGFYPPNTQLITIDNDCGEINPVLIVTRVEINEVSQICTAELPNTECSGGSLSGIEEHIYQALVVLPAPCDAWTFSCQVGIRNASTNVANAGSNPFYAETKMYSVTDNCNNSPTFNSQPIPYVCTGQVTNYDFGILELDGDSLTFEFVEARGSGGAVLSYASGYTFDQPIPGITMNPETGLLSFTQNLPGNYVITVLITEYDICGDLVGSMMVEIQVIVEQCTNQVPTLVETPSIIQNFNNFGTNANIADDRKISLCTGDRFCFDIQFDDPNLGDNVILSSNVANFLPGATFTQVTGNPATATICWSFAQGYTGSVISINATDDVCPVPGFADVAIKLDVPPAIFPGEDDTLLVCGTEGTIDLFDYLGGYFQTNGQWYDPNNNPISNIVADASIMVQGEYYYRVIPDTAGVLCNAPPNQCVDADSAYLTVIASNLSSLNLNNLVNETGPGANDGQAQIGPITGNFPPFTVVWQSPYSGIHDTQIINNNGMASQTNLYQDQLGGDPWIVTVTDSNNCSTSIEFFIYECADGLTIDPIVGHVNCFGDATGSINTRINGGLQIGGQEFVVITNASGDTLNGANENPPDYRQELQLIPAGAYTVNVFDASGCEATISVIVKSEFPSRPQILYETVDLLCFGDETGAIVITDVINAHGDVDDIYFSWAPIPPGNPPSDGTPGRVGLTNLPAGDYTVEVTDTLGCTAEPSPIVITIAEPNNLQGEFEVEQEPLCRTNSGQTGKGLINGRVIDNFNGAGNVKYEWTHLSTGQTSDVPTFNVRAPGLIELLLRDANECVWKDTLLLDSINPEGDFEITSEEFYLEDIYEGEEDVKIRVTNQTDILTMKAAADPNADIIFLWNLNAGMVNDQNNWFFTNSLEERPDTVYSGVINDGPTPYDVCLVIRNSNDCVDTTCKQVLVHRIPELTLPNVFTPGAPPNEEFYFPVVGYQEFTAEVFNRYGIKVAEFTELDDKWDGNHFETGKPCSDGVYYFTYKAVTTNDTEKTGSGQIHLLRHRP